jgi:molybdopterin-guanine dinucleotide biosynthesis protein A
MTEAIAGVILAGGLASRMGGGDKGFIRIGGKPILDHVIARLKPQTEALAINANGDASRFQAYGLPVLPDTIPGSVGPLAGVLAGLEWAANLGFDFIVTVATDTPFFPRDLVVKLKSSMRDSNAELAVAAYDTQHHPVFGLWPVALREDLRRAIAEEGIRKVDEWTARHRLAVAQFGPKAYDPFFNANRPEDLNEAAAILSRYAP